MRYISLRSLAGVFGALACLASPAFAKPVTMHCQVSGPDSGWIAEQIFFEYDSGRDTGRVIDAIIYHFEKKPVVAEITEDSSKKLVITWRLTTRVSSQTTKMGYRLAYFKTNGKVTVQAKPHGFANNYTARGRCRQIDEPLPTG